MYFAINVSEFVILYHFQGAKDSCMLYNVIIEHRQEYPYELFYSIHIYDIHKFVGYAEVIPGLEVEMLSNWSQIHAGYECLINIIVMFQIQVKHTRWR